MLSTEEHWRVIGTFYPSKHPIMLLWCLRVFHSNESILNRKSELRYRVPHRLRCLPWHDICKKRRPNVAPVVGGSETHAGGDRQYGASIVRIVVRSLALQNGGSKIRCILSLRTIACWAISLRHEEHSARLRLLCGRTGIGSADSGKSIGVSTAPFTIQIVRCLLLYSHSITKLSGQARDELEHCALSLAALSTRALGVAKREEHWAEEHCIGKQASIALRAFQVAGQPPQ